MPLKKPFLLFGLITLGLLVLNVIYGDLSTFWAAMERSSVIVKFCETYHADALIKHPINTWSNLAYLFFGLILINYGVNDLQDRTPKNLIRAFPFFSIIWGVTQIYLFAGSFLYHASATKFFQLLDMSGVLATCTVPFFYAIGRVFLLWKKLPTVRFILINHGMIIFGIILVNFLLYYFNLLERFFFGIFIGTTIIFIIIPYFFVKIKAKYSDFVIALILLFFGVTCWMFDQNAIICNPESWFQGHALWHILTAMSLYYLYTFFRSEQKL